MPESTPVYGITYPCATDVIDAADFATFATDVDNALAILNDLSQTALTRPAARITGSVISLPTGVDTLATYIAEDFDNDGMADLAVSTSRLTVQTAGTYMVIFEAIINSATTNTSAAVAIAKNGTIEYRKKDGNTTNSLMPLLVAGLFDAVPGDFFTGLGYWTGTGGPSDIFVPVLSARMVNRP